MNRILLALSVFVTLLVTGCAGKAQVPKSELDPSWVYACDLVTFAELDAARLTNKELKLVPTINTDQQCTWDDSSDGQFFIHAQTYSSTKAAGEGLDAMMEKNEQIALETIQLARVDKALRGCDSLSGRIIFWKRNVVASVMIMLPGVYAGTPTCTWKLELLAQTVANRV